MWSVASIVTLSLLSPSLAKKHSVHKVSNIVGGTVATGSEYPWIVTFKYLDLDCGFTTSHFCTGSVYENDYNGFTFILSAAHCFEDLEQELEDTNQEIKDEYNVKCDMKLVAEIGRDDSDDINESGYERVYIDDLLLHEDYNEDGNDNDIAILWGSEAVQLDSVNLQKTPDCCESGDPVRVIGYGADSDGELTDTLESADMEISSWQTCRLTYGSALTIRMICALGDGQDACNGDSGGPLLAGDRDKDSPQVGVTSFGTEECADGLPTVWIEVGRYYEWINSSTANVDLSLYPDDENDVEDDHATSLKLFGTVILALFVLILQL